MALQVWHFHRKRRRVFLRSRRANGKVSSVSPGYPPGYFLSLGLRQVRISMKDQVRSTYGSRGHLGQRGCPQLGHSLVPCTKISLHWWQFRLTLCLLSLKFKPGPFLRDLIVSGMAIGMAVGFGSTAMALPLSLASLSRLIG